MGRRIVCLLTGIIFCMVTLCGCWDKVEIDRRGFVGVIMLDMAPPGYQEKIASEMKNIPGADEQEGQMIKVTYSFPSTGILGGGEGGGGGGPEKGFKTVTSIATSLPKANGYVDSKISRRLYFGHAKVIIFGEEFVKNREKFMEVVDYLGRDPNINWAIRGMVADGEASKTAEMNPKDEKLLFRYLRGILDNEVTSGRILDVRFNEFMSMMTENGIGMLPRVHIAGDEAEISGLSLFKDYKYVGYLSEYDTLYFNTLNGTRKGGRVYINHDGLKASFTTSNTTRKVKLENSDVNNLEIGIHVQVEGNLSNIELKGKKELDAETIAALEQELKKTDEESCGFVIKRLQGEFKVDALGMGEYLRKYHPTIWDQVGDKWDKVYPMVKITPVVDYRIRRVGLTK